MGAEFGFSSCEAKQTMIQFMGIGGAKQRMIKNRLCRRYDWTQKSGYQILKRFHA